MWISETLYSQILQVMPIPCVDLLVVGDADKVLLLLRKNEPAADQWWFPGGRVLLGEDRREAAIRKLKEECGLVSTQFEEIGTFDIVFSDAPKPRIHSITTLFKLKIGPESNLQLDQQSYEFCWLTSKEWLKRELHPFIRQRIEAMT